jgi:hypothetical protein
MVLRWLCFEVEVMAIHRSITAITANNAGMARPLITTHLNSMTMTIISDGHQSYHVADSTE